MPCVAGLLTDKQLAGIREKLKRSDETIHNLNAEIVAFLKPPEAGFGQDRLKAANKFAEHASREIPLRFGMITGEIAHHLRSSLDHIVWLLSRESYRSSREGKFIGFPVLTEVPGKKDKFASYDRKIEGVTSAAARDLIKQLQPYHTANPTDDPLAIIHHLDRVDKHQTIVLIAAFWNMSAQIPPSRTWVIGGFDVNQEPFFSPNRGPEADKLKLQFSQYIALGEFGERKRQALIPTLTQLANVVRDVVRQFSEL